MNLRRIVKPLSAVLLIAGLLVSGVAPADAAMRPGHSPTDTGWGAPRF